MSTAVENTNFVELIESEVVRLPESWRFTPIRNKRGHRDGWQNDRLTAKQLISVLRCEQTKEQWNGYAVTNLSEAGYVVLDLDTEEARIEAARRVLPHTQVFASPDSKSDRCGNAIYRLPDGFDTGNLWKLVPFKGCEILLADKICPGSYYPSRNGSIGAYRWLEKFGPDDVEIAIAPQWVLDAIAGRIRRVAELAERGPVSLKDATLDDWRIHLTDVLAWIDPDCDYNEWFRVLCGIKSVNEDLFDVAETWSAKGDKFDSVEFSSKWESISPEGGATLASVYYLAAQNGWDGQRWVKKQDQLSSSGPVPKYLHLTDKGKLVFQPQGRIAADMVQMWQQSLMVKAGFVYEYRDGVWKQANADTPLIRIRVTDELAQGTDQSHTANMARAIAQLVADGLESCHLDRTWNTDRRFMPLQDGVYDFQSGKMLPHSPANYLRWKLPYSLPTGPSELGGPIIDFFRTALGSDRKAELLILCMAATVRGLLPKHNLMVKLEGVAKSGKSTIRKMMTALVGFENTCVKQSLDDFNSRFGRVDIPGKRMICFPELSAPKNSSAWELLKDMVTGGSVPIEYKGRNQIDNYISDAAVWMDTNYSTGYRRSDMGGLERRTILFRFTNQLAKVDPNFFEIVDGKPVGRMAQYLPGLLKFLISIPVEWIESTLSNWSAFCPAAKLEYLESLIENDPLADWMDRYLVLAPGKQLSTSVLHTSYERFCQENKEVEALSVKKFGRLLKDQLTARFNGQTKTYRNSSERGIEGIRFREHGEEETKTPRLIASTAMAEPDEPVTLLLSNVTVMSLLKVLQNKAYDISDISDISKIRVYENSDGMDSGLSPDGGENSYRENLPNVTNVTNVTGVQNPDSEAVSEMTLGVTSSDVNVTSNVISPRSAGKRGVSEIWARVRAVEEARQAIRATDGSDEALQLLQQYTDPDVWTLAVS